MSQLAIDIAKHRKTKPGAAMIINQIQGAEKEKLELLCGVLLFTTGIGVVQLFYIEMQVHVNFFVHQCIYNEPDIVHPSHIQ